MSCKEAGPQMEGKKRFPEDDLEGLFKEFRWPTVSAKRRTSSPDGDNKTVPTMSSKEVGQKMEEKKRPPEQELEGLFKEFRWPTVPAKRRTASRDPDNSIVPILPIAKAVCQNRCFSESTSKVLEARPKTMLNRPIILWNESSIAGAAFAVPPGVSPTREHRRARRALRAAGSKASASTPPRQ